MIYFAINMFFLFFYSIVYKFAKKKKPFKRAFLTMLVGLLILFAVDIAGIFTGVYLPVSLLSVTIAACGGVPGVAAMMIFAWVL